MRLLRSFLFTKIKFYYCIIRDVDEVVVVVDVCVVDVAAVLTFVVVDVDLCGILFIKNVYCLKYYPKMSLKHKKEYLNNQGIRNSPNVESIPI